MKTMGERIKVLRDLVSAGRVVARGASGTDRRCATVAADTLESALDLLFPSNAAEEIPILDWFGEVRALLAELPGRIPIDDVDIALVGRADFFGARCASFAATGETPTQAMLKLRDKLREAVAKRAVASDTEPTPPTVRTR